MTRTILKVLISLLFLAVSAIAAIFAIKHFMGESMTEKYGIEPIEYNYDDFKPEEKQVKEEKPIKLAPVEFAMKEGRKYGVAPIQMSDKERELMQKLKEESTNTPIGSPAPRPRGMERSKYGVAPVQRPEFMPTKYGIAPIQMSDKERELRKEEARKKAMEADVEKYGVFPVFIEPIEEDNQKK